MRFHPAARLGGADASVSMNIHSNGGEAEHTSFRPKR